MNDQLCAVHSAISDRRAHCSCPIGPKCPNCGEQQVYNKIDVDGLPFKACSACQEEWDDERTFIARKELMQHRELDKEMRSTT